MVYLNKLSSVNFDIYLPTKSIFEMSTKKMVTRFTINNLCASVVCFFFFWLTILFEHHFFKWAEDEDSLLSFLKLEMTLLLCRAIQLICNVIHVIHGFESMYN
jgi:hypothetical protein